MSKYETLGEQIEQHMLNKEIGDEIIRADLEGFLEARRRAAEICADEAVKLWRFKDGSAARIALKLEAAIRALKP